MPAITVEQFKEVFGDAKELTIPMAAITPQGDRHPVSFSQLILEGENGRRKGIIQLEQRPGSTYISGSTSYTQIEYQEQYGLAVKRFLQLMTVPGNRGREKTEILNGRISYDLGGIEIVYGINYNAGIDPIEDFFRKKDYFHAVVGVHPIPVKEKDFLPAYAAYGWKEDGKSVKRAEFVNADFEDTLEGLFERRTDPDSSWVFQLTTDFQLNQTGEKIGIYTFLDGESCDRKAFFQETQINPSKSVLLKGEQYQAMISSLRIPCLANPVNSLGFSRMNMETGESWMLSVPKTVHFKKFTQDLRTQPFEDFFRQYPAVFCVKQLGQPSRYFSTVGEIANAQ